MIKSQVTISICQMKFLITCEVIRYTLVHTFVNGQNVMNMLRKIGMGFHKSSNSTKLGGVSYDLSVLSEKLITACRNESQQLIF